MMTSADVYAWLVEATLATSIAILAMLALRRPLRAAFGPGVAYAGWGAVPVSLLATMLPAGASVSALQPLAAIQPPIRLVAMHEPMGLLPDLTVLACITWACGGLAFALHLYRQQRHFVRRLGRLVDIGEGAWRAESVAGLPAAIGLWAPRIVMPADALSRYDVAEQSLMLAHEREHIARGDLLANACVALLRCIFWFNPLLHLAAGKFRDDQELDCDQRVIARHPQSRRVYGEAMLKTLLVGAALPLGCHWGQTHPLKERIEMLKRPFPSSTRRAGGRVFVVAILLAAGYGAWAAQPAPVATERPASASSMPVPAYPAIALEQGVGGNVVLVVDVAVDGHVSKAVVDRSEPAGVFDAAALESVKAWTFEPAMKDGRAVPSQVRVPISFDPEGDPGKRKTGASAKPVVVPTPVAWNSYEGFRDSLTAGWAPKAEAKTKIDDC